MAHRFGLALQAVEITYLTDLAQILVACVAECVEEKVAPYNDPAVQMICHQISFAGNGDQATAHYQKVYDYCERLVQAEADGLQMRKTDGEPVLIPS